MALVLLPLSYPLNFFLEGNFDMSIWAFAFPLDALAAAAVRMHSYNESDYMQARISNTFIIMRVVSKFDKEQERTW